MRTGNITSSTIAALMSNDRSGKNPGKPFYTYVAECNMERRLQRAIETDNFSKPCAWGNLLEIYVQSKDEYISAKYEQRPDEPIGHPEHDFWWGSPDMVNGDTVADLKCPYTLKSFCQLVQPLYDGKKGIEAMNELRDNHKEGEDYYWQLVSNAILTNSKYAELFIFCPYLSELVAIQELAHEQPQGVASRFYFIANANIDELPYLPDGGYYKNLNVIRFEIPQADKDALTARVKMAGELLETVKVEA